MEIKTVKINELKPHPKNPRVHPDSAIEKLERSIKEYGWTNPVLVSADGYVLAGHARLKAAEKAGIKEVPVIYLPLEGAKAEAYLIADNRLQDETDWDYEKLKDLLQELDTGEFDLELTGFDMGEIEDLVAQIHVPEEIIEDEVPEPPDEPITKPGDLWILGRHRLLCGDSTSADDVEKLMNGNKADMLFTDTPYGVNYTGGHFHSGDVNIKRPREKLIADDTANIYREFLPVVLPFVDGPCYMWFASTKGREVYNALHENNTEIHALLIWHKVNATYAAMNAQYKQRHEPCLYFKPKGSTLRWIGPTTESTVWEIKKDAVNEYHPTQKPIALAAKAIKNHDVRVVLDVFGGSGSTLIACEQLNKICYMMELDEKYVDVIVNRYISFKESDDDVFLIRDGIQIPYKEVEKNE